VPLIFFVPGSKIDNCHNDTTVGSVRPYCVGLKYKVEKSPMPNLRVTRVTTCSLCA
jgi:hypothetical protein